MKQGDSETVDAFGLRIDSDHKFLPFRKNCNSYNFVTNLTKNCLKNLIKHKHKQFFWRCFMMIENFGKFASVLLLGFIILLLPTPLFSGEINDYSDNELLERSIEN